MDAEDDELAGLTLARDGSQVRLRWEPPRVAREIAGYNVYRSQESGRAYRPVNRERIASTEFIDTPPSGPAFYAVAAVISEYALLGYGSSAYNDIFEAAGLYLMLLCICRWIRSRGRRKTNGASTRSNTSTRP